MLPRYAYFSAVLNATWYDMLADQKKCRPPTQNTALSCKNTPFNLLALSDASASLQSHDDAFLNAEKAHR